jgi:hypothetical protein
VVRSPTIGTKDLFAQFDWQRWEDYGPEGFGPGIQGILPDALSFGIIAEFLDNCWRKRIIGAAVICNHDFLVLIKFA